MPRVVFVNRVYRPAEAATAQLLADLAESLAARGWPVHVVATGDGPNDIAGVRIHRTGPTWPHAGWTAQAANYRRFLAAVRRELPGRLAPGDLLVPMTDPPMLGPAAAAIAQTCGARIVHWIQDVYPEILSAHLGRGLALLLAPLRWRRNRAWSRAAACVPVSEAMAAHVRTQGVDAERIAVLPNWAPRELETAALPADVEAWRNAWGVADKFVVAYSGNLGRVHEFATILTAAAELAHDPLITFLVIGDGPRAAEVRAAAAHLRLPNLRFLPPQPRSSLATSLAAADVHLVSLRPEFSRLVSPSKLAGALAAGRPVLFIGPAEAGPVVITEGCGAVTAPGQSTAMAARLREWSRDRAVVERLGRAARAAYTRHFTLAGAVARWEELLLRAAA